MANPKGNQEPLFLSVDDINQVPECSICNEKYDDSDQDSIPRNLSCGHSMCSSKITLIPAGIGLYYVTCLQSGKRI